VGLPVTSQFGSTPTNPGTPGPIRFSAPAYDIGRIAAAGLTGDMIIAMATVTFGNGIASTAPGGGYELNLALAALAFVVALLGTGRFSLDVGLRMGWERTRSAKPQSGEVSYGQRPDRVSAS
jgi:hypothetical protein